MTRFRLVANFNAMPSSLSYDDVRTTTVYAETQTISTSDEAGTGLGGDGALQVSLYSGLGLLAGYSYGTRDVSGTADVTRPHPLYLNRPRTASAELSGYGYTEGAFDVDVAYSPRAPRTPRPGTSTGRSSRASPSSRWKPTSWTCRPSTRGTRTTS